MGSYVRILRRGLKSSPRAIATDENRRPALKVARRDTFQRDTGTVVNSHSSYPQQMLNLIGLPLSVLERTEGATSPEAAPPNVVLTEVL